MIVQGWNVYFFFLLLLVFSSIFSEQDRPLSNELIARPNEIIHSKSLLSSIYSQQDVLIENVEFVNLMINNFLIEKGSSNNEK